MSKVLWHVTMSLDGFIASQDNSTEWMFAHGSLLGDGLRLFSGTASPPVRLRKTRCDDAGQITDLSFEVLR